MITFTSNYLIFPTKTNVPPVENISDAAQTCIHIFMHTKTESLKAHLSPTKKNDGTAHYHTLDDSSDFARNHPASCNAEIAEWTQLHLLILYCVSKAFRSDCN